MPRRDLSHSPRPHEKSPMTTHQSIPSQSRGGGASSMAQSSIGTRSGTGQMPMRATPTAPAGGYNSMVPTLSVKKSALKDSMHGTNPAMPSMWSGAQGSTAIGTQSVGRLPSVPSAMIGTNSAPYIANRRVPSGHHPSGTASMQPIGTAESLEETEEETSGSMTSTPEQSGTCSQASPPGTQDRAMLATRSNPFGSLLPDEVNPFIAQQQSRSPEPRQNHQRDQSESGMSSSVSSWSSPRNTPAPNREQQLLASGLTSMENSVEEIAFSPPDQPPGAPPGTTLGTQHQLPSPPPGSQAQVGANRGSKTDALSENSVQDLDKSFMVRVPPGLRPGQLIQATSPDGQIVTAAIPPDVKAGQLIAVPCWPMSNTPVPTDPRNERTPLVPPKQENKIFSYKALLTTYLGTWLCLNMICWMLYFWVVHYNIGNTPWGLWVTVFSSLPWLLVFPKWMAAWLCLNIVAWFLWWSVATLSVIYIPWPAIITVLTSVCMIFVLREVLQKELEVTVPAPAGPAV